MADIPKATIEESLAAYETRLDHAEQYLWYINQQKGERRKQILAEKTFDKLLQGRYELLQMLLFVPPRFTAA